MKTDFTWAWNGHKAQPDKLMTRTRMAVLLRAWRRALRQKANSSSIAAVKRLGAHQYRIEHAYGETATITWSVKA